MKLFGDINGLLQGKPRGTGFILGIPEAEGQSEGRKGKKKDFGTTQT